MSRNGRRSSAPDRLAILSFGFFILMVGVIWIITPNFYGEVTSFVNDFRLENLTENVGFPAPMNNHQFYTRQSCSCA